MQTGSIATPGQPAARRRVAPALLVVVAAVGSGFVLVGCDRGDGPSAPGVERAGAPEREGSAAMAPRERAAAGEELEAAERRVRALDPGGLESLLDDEERPLLDRVIAARLLGASDVGLALLASSEHTGAAYEIYRANLIRDQGLIDEAGEIVDQVLAAEPVVPWVLYHAAAYALERGDHRVALERADDVLERVAAERPGEDGGLFHRALNIRASALRRLGRVEDALAASERASHAASLQEDPWRASYLAQYGRLLLATDDAVEAQGVLQDADEVLTAQIGGEATPPPGIGAQALHFLRSRVRQRRALAALAASPPDADAAAIQFRAALADREQAARDTEAAAQLRVEQAKLWLAMGHAEAAIDWLGELPEILQRAPNVRAVKLMAMLYAGRVVELRAMGETMKQEEPALFRGIFPVEFDTLDLLVGEMEQPPTGDPPPLDAARPEARLTTLLVRSEFEQLAAAADELLESEQLADGAARSLVTLYRDVARRSLEEQAALREAALSTTDTP